MSDMSDEMKVFGKLSSKTGDWIKYLSDILKADQSHLSVLTQLAIARRRLRESCGVICCDVKVNSCQ